MPIGLGNVNATGGGGGFFFCRVIRRASLKSAMDREAGGWGPRRAATRDEFFSRTFLALPGGRAEAAGLGLIITNFWGRRRKGGE